MNVIAYTRVSTDAQVEAFGLESQRQIISEYCKKNGHTIMQWYSDEGESGAKFRPVLDGLCYSDFPQNPPVEAVVVAKSDRVARDIFIYYAYAGQLMRKGIELISVTEDFGAYGSFGEVLRAFTLVQAKMERENITKRTTGGRVVKAQGGGYAGGSTPYGYDTVNKELVVNEVQAEAVRLIFQMRGGGHTLQHISDVLNERGYLTSKGKRFSTATIQVILRNKKTYEGYYRYGSDEWVIGKHVPILKGE